jgi:single-strand DNA-binding protein
MENYYDIFVGRLGVNPDLRYTAKKEPVCTLSVAVNKDNEEKAEWKRVIVWGKQAELCSLYLKKGYEVFVQGRMNSRDYEDKLGNPRTITEWKAKLIGFPNI